ncbi:hypothetical protein STRAU_1775 [Streptomyces aurantiacus JA 4570]|uniref:Uncharacterized protein n=1 Tax=Streptomyces aurantiacus JA 4570 TaxID=1286094 RepID=S4AUN7_9ACTN|nr:hypothetical protein [Streptomyces aurantiacus]EPH45147.1 hypothetical protein STRAU_1775 [Streptomyces aurantiacus JA 4570]
MPSDRLGGPLEAAQSQLGGGQARAPAGVVPAEEADQLAETQGHGAHLPSYVVVGAARLRRISEKDQEARPART